VGVPVGGEGGQYTCTCAEGYTGVVCQDVDTSVTTTTTAPTTTPWFMSLPKYKDHYYYLTPDNLNKMSWVEANLQCVGLGGYLAEINDQEELDFVDSLKDGFVVARIGTMWSGTTDAGKWIYMTSGDDVTYTYAGTLGSGAEGVLGVWQDACLLLFMEEGSSNNPTAMASWWCTRDEDEFHNLCEIPAAA